jgi:hypothetical protein
MKNKISRRHFLSAAAVAPAALSAATPDIAGAPRAVAPNPREGNWVRWLDGRAPAVQQGITWGTPWPRGRLRDPKHFALRGADGQPRALQSWPLAYWPDGSLKFTAHAMAPGGELGGGPFEVISRRGAAPAASI